MISSSDNQKSQARFRPICNKILFALTVGLIFDEKDHGPHLKDQDLRVLLSWYAEDVMRTVEREVRNIESEIRKEYPGAQYIELEPMSKDADRFAIDDGLEASLKRIEIESLNRYLKSGMPSGLPK